MSVIIVNKKIVSSKNPHISHTDRGFTLGHGLFETIFVKKSTIPAWHYHWMRLKTSAPLIDIILPFSEQELKGMIGELIIENNLQNNLAGARVTVTHGEAERGLLPLQSFSPNVIISVFHLPPPTENPYSALIVTTRKNEHTLSSRIKSLAYLDNILAKQEARHQNYDEAILLNTASNVADGSVSNIYMVKNGCVVTPTVADGALPGVVRSILFHECNHIVPLVERTISPDELLQADEIFLTNALMGVKPVGRVNTREFRSFDTANRLNKALCHFYGRRHQPS